MSSSMPEQRKTLSAAELEEIRRRCDNATPGPWKSLIEGRDHTSGSSFIMTGQGKTRGDDIELSGATSADHDFIAHARQDIPQLLDEIAKLKNFAEYAQRERQRLGREREKVLGVRRELKERLGEIEREISAIDAYATVKAGKSPGSENHVRRRRGRVSGSGKGERLLQLLRQHRSGLTRREILEKLGLKGDKAGVMSISNTLNALTKAGQVARGSDRKYVPSLE